MWMLGVKNSCDTSVSFVCQGLRSVYGCGWHRLDSCRAELLRTLPLHSERHELSGSAHLCRLCTRRPLETNQ